MYEVNIHIEIVFIVKIYQFKVIWVWNCNCVSRNKLVSDSLKKTWEFFREVKSNNDSYFMWGKHKNKLFF